jgi:hypothetical protein
MPKPHTVGESSPAEPSQALTAFCTLLFAVAAPILGALICVATYQLHEPSLGKQYSVQGLAYLNAVVIMISLAVSFAAMRSGIAQIIYWRARRRHVAEPALPRPAESSGRGSPLWDRELDVP